MPGEYNKATRTGIKDAADWIAAGGDGAQLEELRKATPIGVDIGGAVIGTAPNGAGQVVYQAPDYHPNAPRPRGPLGDGRYTDFGADLDPEPPPPWQTPSPLSDQHLLPVPAFDFELLPADLRAWVADIAERMQVAPDLVAVAAM